MRSLSQLSDHVLLHDLKALASRERVTLAELLAHLAEAEDRRLHLPAAYPSMHAYCVGELGMTTDEAHKRIQAARAARRFPAVLAAVADGRLHLSAVVLLAPHLTEANVDERIAAATHRSKSEISALLAAVVTERDSSEGAALAQLVPEPVGFIGDSSIPAVGAADSAPGEAAAEPSPDTLSLARAAAAPTTSHHDLRVSLDAETHELLRYAKALLGHAIPSGDTAQVLRRALVRLVECEEKRIFAAHCRTRPRRGSPKGRHVPASVRQAVWLRDGGRCTFTSEAGLRCTAITRIEFDHVTPVAKGGDSTAANLRLCCRAHNQYAAEREYGAGFMEGKREAARARAARRRAATEQRAAAESREPVESSPPAERSEKPRGAAERASAPTPPATARPARQAYGDDVIPWLRKLGLRADEARRGAAMCEGLAAATLEERVKVALGGLARERYRQGVRAAGAG